MRRIFIATPIRVQPVFLGAYRELRDQLADEAIKWVDERNMHLTLKFLGETEEKLIAEIKKDLEKMSGRFSPFDITLKGFGYFGSRRQPTVLYAGVFNQEILAQMAERTDHFTSQLGFEPESRPFKAHLTLGRIKYLRNTEGFLKTVDLYKEVQFQVAKIDEITLFESILSREGPVYKPLLSIRLP